MPVSPARAAAFDILLRVNELDSYASELLHSDRLNDLTTADRGLCTELVMGVLRWQSAPYGVNSAWSNTRPVESIASSVRREPATCTRTKWWTMAAAAVQAWRPSG